MPIQFNQKTIEVVYRFCFFLYYICSPFVRINHMYFIDIEHQKGILKLYTIV